MTTEEVTDKLIEQQESLQKMKLGNAVSQLENPLQIRMVRRDIARLKTELHNRSAK